MRVSLAEVQIARGQDSLRAAVKAFHERKAATAPAEQPADPAPQPTRRLNLRHVAFPQTLETAVALTNAGSLTL